MPKVPCDSKNIPIQLSDHGCVREGCRHTVTYRADGKSTHALCDCCTATKAGRIEKRSDDDKTKVQRIRDQQNDAWASHRPIPAPGPIALHDHGPHEPDPLDGECLAENCRTLFRHDHRNRGYCHKHRSPSAGPQ